MSPEQIRGRGVDERTDLWAIGCVLYELLTGERAFGRETPGDTLAAVLTDEPDYSGLPSETPEPLRLLLKRLLAKQADRRPSCAGSVVEELETIQGSLVGPPSKRSSRRPMASVFSGVAAVVLLVTLLWLARGGFPGKAVVDRSIAVLPFETIGVAENASFTDGIHVDMLTRLSQLPDVEVTSRTSVMRYRDSEAALPEIAEGLGVAWVLLGEVQQAGDRVRLNARLVDAREDRQEWAQTFERQLTAENLFEIQRELTEQIARELQARFRQPDGSATGGGPAPTNDLDAYRLYVRGRSMLERWSEPDLREAARAFMGAIEVDPEYALAWAGLADSQSLLRWYGFEPVEGAPEPETAAERAMELGPQLAEVRLSQAIVLSSRRVTDGPAALSELQRAVELQPSLAVAHVWMAWLHLLMGDADAALAPAERAVDLDPLSPPARVFLGEVHLARGETQAALREISRGRGLQPDQPFSAFMEAIALHHLGRYDEAVDRLESLLGSLPPEARTPSRSQVYGVLAVALSRASDSAGLRGLSGPVGQLVDPLAEGLYAAAVGDDAAALEAFGRVEHWGQLSNEILRYFFPDVLRGVRSSRGYEELLGRANYSWGVDRQAPARPGR
jgi:TolB-like protein